MTNQEIYDILMSIDSGHLPTSFESTEITSINKVKWNNIAALPKCLGMMKSLTHLDLSDNRLLDDISMVSTLGDITHLYLRNTSVRDISALKQLKNIVYLDLCNTRVREVFSLSHLRKLKYLDLSGLQFISFNPVFNLKGLSVLHLRSTNIDDINALQSMTGLKELSLRNTKIKNIDALSGLTSLVRLDIYGTFVTDINALSGLDGLKELDLGSSKVRDFSVLSTLTELTALNLSDTKIKNFEIISDLVGLKKLDLSGTNVSNLSTLAGLQELTYLDIHNTSLKSLSGIKHLKNLEYLDLSRTLIKFSISEISMLTKLTYLDLHSTSVDNISFLSTLKELVSLDLSHNGHIKSISALSGLTKMQSLSLSHMLLGNIDSISTMTDLKELDLSYNFILNNISAVKGLTKLEKLDLRGLKISKMPDSLIDLELEFIINEHPRGSGIYIYGLTLTQQPIEIFSQSSELIRAYYREKDQVPVNECKVIFLGDAEAGKTHSIKRLLKKGDYLTDFDGNSTPGIEITVSTTKLDNSDISVNYWDFGGQEIQHSMHRMFLTERTIYVVFLNARQDPLDDRARYWMENVKSFAPNAPVLLVINKIDQNDRPKFNEEGLLETYKNQIKNVVRMSALKDEPSEFIKKLQNSIDDIIIEMPTVSRKVPKSWKSLMEDIREMPDHYLTTSQFKEKCLLCKIRDYSIIHDDLVDLFQVIGISFCYYKNRTIADYILLNPKWLVNALYTIVTNSAIAADNGVITQEDLYSLLQEEELHGIKIRRVLQNMRYENLEINYILGVTRMFRLSYPLKDGSEFFPMLCDGNEKLSLYEAVSEQAIHFIFRYNYLPTNVIHRLIVDMQRDLDYKYVWFSGAVFRNVAQKQIAYIYYKENDLHIYVEGKDSFYNPNEYLTPIQNFVRNINEDMGLFATELVTYRKDGVETELSFKFVEGNLKRGIDTVYDPKIDEVIDLRDIIWRYNDRRPKIKREILARVIQALGQMQNDITYYRNDNNSRDLEDSRNRFVSAQLRICGYNCGDQVPGGTSSTQKFIGERDIVFQNWKGQDILIYEGVNLKNFDSDNIEAHLDKLMQGYNPQGLPYGMMVTYLECKREKYEEFLKKYKEHVIEYAPESYRCIGQPAFIPTEGQYISCMEMNYECGSVYFTIYHIVVRMAV